ncbi:radical SAM protein [Candidatus Microgenomates bacterium]|nr:radical SAM protein [Candidatus Microgenomates bacterium]
MKNPFRLFQYGLVYTKNYFLESLAVRFPKIIPKPLYVGLSVGTICNFRCKQCDLWRVPTRPEKYLTTKQVKSILKDLRNWLGPFRLFFTGSEPFLREDIVEILKFASKKNIYTILTSNGWLVDEKMAEKIIVSGLDVICISLDGADPKTHNFLRGKEGAFKKAVAVLKNLKKARKRSKAPAIYINTVIMKQNLGQLESLVKLTAEIGIDAIRFEALESKWLFGNADYNSDWFKKSPLWPTDWQKIKKVFDGLKELKKTGFPIKNTFKELEDLKIYYKNPLAITERYKFCFTGVRNFSVDEYGKVKLCFGMEPVGDLLKQKPWEVWHGKKAEGLREVIRNCQRYCRILPCNKREELPQIFSSSLKRLLKKY